MPDPSRQLTVCSIQEPIALVFVLADEHDVRPIAVREARVLTPPAQERVVAPELRVVLVDALRSVVLDEEDAAAVRVGSRHLEDGVGTHESGARIAEPFGGPVVAEAQHPLPGPCLARRLDVRLSLPREATDRPEAVEVVRAEQFSSRRSAAWTELPGHHSCRSCGAVRNLYRRTSPTIETSRGWTTHGSIRSRRPR